MSGTIQHVYAVEDRFSFPRWLRPRLLKALSKLGRRRGSYVSTGTALYDLGRATGLYVDHPGRRGEDLTLEPYEDCLDEEALQRFADALCCIAQVSSGGEWNPEGKGPFGVPTRLIIVTPKR